MSDTSRLGGDGPAICPAPRSSVAVAAGSDATLPAACSNSSAPPAAASRLWPYGPDAALPRELAARIAELFKRAAPSSTLRLAHPSARAWVDAGPHSGLSVGSDDLEVLCDTPLRPGALPSVQNANLECFGGDAEESAYDYNGLSKEGRARAAAIARRFPRALAVLAALGGLESLYVYHETAPLDAEAFAGALGALTRLRAIDIDHQLPAGHRPLLAAAARLPLLTQLACKIEPDGTFEDYAAEPFRGALPRAAWPLLKVRRAPWGLS